MSTRYRKNPVVIDAWRWPGEERTLRGAPGWMHAALREDKLSFVELPLGQGVGLHIHTLEGVMLARPGMWVIRGVKSELYSCDADIFAETYTRVLEGEEDVQQMVEVPLFAAESNTDLTEGRGAPFWCAVSPSHSAAKRAGRRKNVQGHDCPVERIVGFKYPGRGGPIYIPAAPVGCSTQWVQPDARDDEEDKGRLAHNEAFKAMLAKGVTREELAALGVKEVE